MHILITSFLNNIARWTFTLLIVLEGFFPSLSLFLFYNDFGGFFFLNGLILHLHFWWLYGELNVHCFIKVIIFI